MTMIGTAATVTRVDLAVGGGCLACGATTARPSVYGGYRFLDEDYRLWRCGHCDFRWINPLPTSAVLEAMYHNDEYFDYYALADGDVHSYETQARADSLIGQRLLRALQIYRPSGSVFEIGCAGGRLLRQFREAGYEVSGLEPNPRMVEFARRELGLVVQQGWFPEQQVEGPFDVIVLADVLEHVLNPAQVLTEASGLLHPGGLMLIAQPLDYHWTLFNGVLGATQWWRGRPLTHEQPNHLWQFTPASLRRFLIGCHWQVLNTEVYESVGPPACAFRGAAWRQHTVAALRRLSAWCSNSPAGRWAEWGNRMIVVATPTLERTTHV